MAAPLLAPVTASTAIVPPVPQPIAAILPLLTAPITTPVIAAALPATAHAPPVAVAPVTANPHAHNANIADILPPTTYTVAPPAAPGGVLSLTAQHVHIQETVRGSLLVIEADIAFQDGFPDGHGRNQFVNNALIQTAHLLNYLGLEQRFNEDRLFMRSIATIVSGDLQELVIHYSPIRPAEAAHQYLPWCFEEDHRRISYRTLPSHSCRMSHQHSHSSEKHVIHVCSHVQCKFFSSIICDAAPADLCGYLRPMGSIRSNTTNRMRTRASRARCGACSSLG